MGSDAGIDAGIDDGLPIAEAARQMGITPAALRKRVERGSVQAYQVTGQWYVVVPASLDAGKDAGSTAAAGEESALVVELRARVTSL